MASGKGLSSEQKDRVREAVRELLRRHDDNQSVLAPKLGVTQSSISGLLSGRQGTSYGVARKAAKLLGLSVEDLIEGLAPIPAADERYPNRVKAAQFARGELREDAIAFVLSMDLQLEGDLSALRWLEMMRHWSEQFELGIRP